MEREQGWLVPSIRIKNTVNVDMAATASTACCYEINGFSVCRLFQRVERVAGWWKRVEANSDGMSLGQEQSRDQSEP
jgi:hypothetical protein